MPTLGRARADEHLEDVGQHGDINAGKGRRPEDRTIIQVGYITIQIVHE